MYHVCKGWIPGWFLKLCVWFIEIDFWVVVHYFTKGLITFGVSDIQIFQVQWLGSDQEFCTEALGAQWNQFRFRRTWILASHRAAKIIRTSYWPPNILQQADVIYISRNVMPRSSRAVFEADFFGFKRERFLSQALELIPKLLKRKVLREPKEANLKLEFFLRGFLFF